MTGLRQVSKDIRLSTSATDTLPQPILLLSTSVDPDRILSVAMGNEFIHTEDNEVEYYEAQRNAKGTK